MATIARNASVAKLPLGLRFRGFVAWVAWLFLHLMYLVGCRNRINVLVDWGWNYLTYDRRRPCHRRPRPRPRPPRPPVMRTPRPILDLPRPANRAADWRGGATRPVAPAGHPDAASTSGSTR
jgi:hypothetical protein